MLPQRQDTSWSPYCITPRQTRGPDPVLHLNTNGCSSFNTVLTGLKDAVGLLSTKTSVKEIVMLKALKVLVQR